MNLPAEHSGSAARRAKRWTLALLAEELPKMREALRPGDGIALSRLRTLANLAEQLTKTPDDDLSTIARIIARIEDERAAARR